MIVAAGSILAAQAVEHLVVLSYLRRLLLSIAEMSLVGLGVAYFAIQFGAQPGA
jgi:hypothetical protein